MPVQGVEPLVGGRFEVLELVGGGGIGTVYKTRDRHTGQLAGLKVVEPRDVRVAERFAQEARVLSDLADSRIVRYIAHGTTADGHLYLAMEWLEGEPLNERLVRGPLTVPVALSLVRDVAGALGVAHARGIVHRDVKPSNIFLVDGKLDRVKLLDFGIARWANEGRGLTRTGDLVGTPLYMSPEQVRGERNIGPAADIWSLGCVLYQCVTDKMPFGGWHLTSVLANILFAEPPRLKERVPEVSPELERLVGRMLAKDPGDRPADGAEVFEELVQVGAGAQDATAANAEPVPETLTAGELRLHTAIVLAAADHPELGDAVRAYGGRLETLLNGAGVVTFSGSELPAVRVRKAAQCAQAVHTLLPSTPISIATWRGPVTARWPVGDVIDAALRRLPAGGTADTPQAPVVDDLTAQLLEPTWDIERNAATLLLRGRREGRPERALTPFVGRERELTTLLGAAQNCVENSEAQPLLVTGASGVGKSRLADELVRRLRERHPGLRVWGTRGDPVRSGPPLFLVAELVRRALGLDAERRAALPGRLQKVVPGGDAQRVAEFLGELAGVPFPDEQSLPLQAARVDALLMASEQRRAFLTWLAGETGRAPVLILLEDLHWGDVESVRLIDAALRELHERPLIVLALAQNDVLDMFPKLWQERGLLHVALGELPKRAAERIAQEVLGSRAGPDTVERLVERAGGNAFFLEELLRTVVEGGDVSFPETVLGVAQARLGRLSADARRALRAGSVYGASFWQGGVTALLGGGTTRDEVGGWMAEAVEREVVSFRQGSRLANEVEYGFRHSYLREAAYATLTDEDRARGHRLAGRWLEARGHVDAAVAHYAVGNDHEALAALVRAQARALVAQGRHAVLRDWLLRLPEERRRADAWLSYWVGVATQPLDPPGAGEPFARAYELFLAEADIPGALLAWSGAVDCLLYDHVDVTGLDHWFDELGRVFARIEGTPPPDIEARVAVSLFAAAGRRYPASLSLEPWERRVQDQAEPGDAWFVLAPYLIIYFLFMGKLEEAARMLAGFKPRARAGSLAALYIGTAEVFWLWQTADFDDATRVITETRSATAALGLHVLDFQLDAVRVYVALNTGELELARASLVQMGEIPRGHIALRAHYNFIKGWERIASDDAPEALEHFAASNRLAGESGANTGQEINRVGLIEALIDLDRFEEARDQLAKSKAFCDQVASGHMTQHRHLCEAHMADKLNDVPTRDAALQKAFSLGRELGLTFAAWPSRRDTMRRLCNLALEQGIEPGYVSGLMTKHKLG